MIKYIIGTLALCFFVIIFILGKYGGMSPQDQSIQVRDQLKNLQHALITYKDMHNELPDPDFDNAINTLLNSELKKPVEGGCRQLMSGEDPWGNRYFYKLDDGNKCVVFGSYGENGKDDKGEADDIVFNVNISDKYINDDNSEKGKEN